jgi:hypothetical protein
MPTLIGSAAFAIAGKISAQTMTRAAKLRDRFHEAVMRMLEYSSQRARFAAHFRFSPERFLNAFFSSGR